jgi:3'5'-cyclic nucleotide phosphodiesterase
MLAPQKETVLTRGRPRGLSGNLRPMARSRESLTDYAFRLVMRMALRAGIAHHTGADPVKLKRFLERVSLLYHDNPYHNWHHAVDVAHTAAWLVNRPLFRRAFAPSDVFWLLIAALVHDVDHPGHNNSWETAAQTERARRYEGVSVLERHSLDAAINLMRLPDCRFTERMPDRVRERGLYLMQETILATDFELHGAFLAALGRAIEQFPQEVGFDRPEFSMLILKALLKAADIGNVAQPYAQARIWATRAMQEFRTQGAREAAAGLPVPPINDAARTSLEDAQVYFIRHAALRLFELLARLEPEVGPLVQAIRDNASQYEAEISGEAERTMSPFRGSAS